MKKIIFLIFLALLCSMAFAGDKAEFVNLGFSPDGDYFMFGNYGYNQESSSCYSDIFIVDVDRNVFVPGGVYHEEFDNILSPGQSSMGALFSLLEKTTDKRKNYRIDFLNTGRPLYIRLNDNPKSDENNEQNMNALEFKDFLTGNRYNVQLFQTIEENSSRFYIDLTLYTADGLEKSFRIGHPNYTRRNIVNYTINRIIINPDNSSLVLIIGKTDKNGNIRYMVETVQF